MYIFSIIKIIHSIMKIRKNTNKLCLSFLTLYLLNQIYLILKNEIKRNMFSFYHYHMDFMFSLFNRFKHEIDHK
jgi:hypothetical protein